MRELDLTGTEILLTGSLSITIQPPIILNALSLKILLWVSHSELSVNLHSSTDQTKLAFTSLKLMACFSLLAEMSTLLGNTELMPFLKMSKTEKAESLSFYGVTPKMLLKKTEAHLS